MGLPKSILKLMYEFIMVINYKTNSNFYLPQEIIEIIYLFMVKDYYANKIKKIYSNIIDIDKSIQTVIGYNLIDIEYRTPIANKNILANENISALKYLVNSNISKKYDLNLWANILHILSIQINRLKFEYKCNNIGKKSAEGKKLTILLNLWLQLCKKFNLKIFLETKKTLKYIRAKNILKMNKYNQYLISPMIIQPFSQYNRWIDTNDAMIFLQNKLL